MCTHYIIHCIESEGKVIFLAYATGCIDCVIFSGSTSSSDDVSLLEFSLYCTKLSRTLFSLREIEKERERKKEREKERERERERERKKVTERQRV